MPSVCFYFQVHQPYRLRHYSFFDIGASPFYEDEDANCEIMLKVARKCYLPMNDVLMRLIRKHEGRFKVSFSISGTAIDQFEEYAPEVLESFQALAATGCVEMLDETYCHSLSFLFSREEFREQVSRHRKRIQELFGQSPRVFRDTELIYNNDVAAEIESMGYDAILAEGADHVLGWRSPNFVYMPASCNKMKLLLKNYALSDDIAFRFSNHDWPEFPLTAEKFANWAHSLNTNGEVINLFMDYETFGEHQWASTGIFDFMLALPDAVLKHPDFDFKTPSEVADSLAPKARLDVPQFMSWADAERDLTAWLGNDMQDDAIHALYSCENAVRKLDDAGVIRAWRRLQTSDHFYYMCTKWFSDGDVHKYFNPYGTPYDAYINFMNVLADFRLRLDQRMGAAPSMQTESPQASAEDKNADQADAAESSAAHASSPAAEYAPSPKKEKSGKATASTTKAKEQPSSSVRKTSSDKKKVAHKTKSAENPA